MYYADQTECTYEGYLTSYEAFFPPLQSGKGGLLRHREYEASDTTSHHQVLAFGRSIWRALITLMYGRPLVIRVSGRVWRRELEFIATLFVHCDYLSVSNDVLQSLGNTLRGIPELWAKIVTEPELFFHLAYRLWQPEIYLDAAKHLIGMQILNDQAGRVDPSAFSQGGSIVEAKFYENEMMTILLAIPRRATAGVPREKRTGIMADHHRLIRSLCADLAPIAPQRIDRTLALGIAAGGALTIVAMLAAFGAQPGLDRPAHAVPLAMKLAYAGALALIGAILLRPLAHPDRHRIKGWWLAAPVALLTLVAMVRLATAPEANLPALAFGTTWRECPLRVAALSLPIFAGLVWAMRDQAPIHPRIAGALTGLTAGATAAAIYAVACTETSPAFVLAWYSLGIVIPAAIGATLGPRLMRW